MSCHTSACSQYVHPPAPPPWDLPYTGFNALGLVLVGAGMILLGVAFYRGWRPAVKVYRSPAWTGHRQWLIARRDGHQVGVAVGRVHVRVRLW